MNVLVKHSSKNIVLKTSLDVLHIKKACKIVEELLIALGAVIKPGVKTIDIDKFAGDFIFKRKGASGLKGYMGFPANVCISVNNVAAHGIGCDYVIRDGDLITIDTTVGVDGWYGDGAWTYIAGEATPEKKRLVKAAWKAMLAGIAESSAGKKLGDIGASVKKTALRYGCNVVEDLAGHGIGRKIHEEPVVLHVGKKGTGLPIIPGMVFTIEPILTLGSGKVRFHSDNWSIIIADDNLSAQFECTLAVFKNQTDVLTLSNINLQKYIDFPPMF
ncbi:MAG: type I methionyl aminopeptidase [Spirochaetes bacterium]|nr:type I methionyl aminopeptidase [Spirochaetota bacterium]